MAEARVKAKKWIEHSNRAVNVVIIIDLTYNRPERPTATRNLQTLVEIWRRREEMTDTSTGISKSESATKTFPAIKALRHYHKQESDRKIGRLRNSDARHRSDQQTPIVNRRGEYAKSCHGPDCQ